MKKDLVKLVEKQGYRLYFDKPGFVRVSYPRWSSNGVETYTYREFYRWVKGSVGKGKPVTPWNKNVKEMSNKINRRKTRQAVKSDIDKIDEIPTNQPLYKEDSWFWD